MLFKLLGKFLLKFLKLGRKVYNFFSKLVLEVLKVGNISVISSDILDKYLEILKGDYLFNIFRRFRCLSFDIEVLLVGIFVLNKSDIIGVSFIELG